MKAWVIQLSEWKLGETVTHFDLLAPLLKAIHTTMGTADASIAEILSSFDYI